jgi:hypothetical protein
MLKLKYKRKRVGVKRIKGIRFIDKQGGASYNRWRYMGKNGGSGGPGSS